MEDMGPALATFCIQSRLLVVELDHQPVIKPKTHILPCLQGVLGNCDEEFVGVANQLMI